MEAATEGHHLGGYLVQKSDQDLNGDQNMDHDSLNGSINTNNNRRHSKKPIFHRFWRYLKHTMTGVITGTGKKIVSHNIGTCNISQSRNLSGVFQNK